MNPTNVLPMPSMTKAQLAFGAASLLTYFLLQLLDIAFLAAVRRQERARTGLGCDAQQASDTHLPGQAMHSARCPGCSAIANDLARAGRPLQTPCGAIEISAIYSSVRLCKLCLTSIPGEFCRSKATKWVWIRGRRIDHQLWCAALRLHIVHKQS